VSSTPRRPLRASRSGSPQTAGEAGESLAKAEREAGDLVEQAKVQAEAVIAEAELRAQQLRREAYLRGHAKGSRRAARPPATRPRADRSDHPHGRRGARLKWQVIKNSEMEIVESAIDVAKKIIGEEMTLQPALIAKVVAGALEKVNGTQAVKIRVHPQD